MHMIPALLRSSLTALLALCVASTATAQTPDAHELTAPAPTEGTARIEHIDSMRRTMNLDGHTYAIPPGLAISVHGQRNVPPPQPQTGMHVNFHARSGSGATPPSLTRIEVIPD